MAIGLRQQFTCSFLVAGFSPGGAKTGNTKMVSTALPKAKNADRVSRVIGRTYAVAGEAGGLEG
jgi:hypothetical protein